MKKFRKFGELLFNLMHGPIELFTFINVLNLKPQWNSTRFNYLAYC